MTDSANALIGLLNAYRPNVLEQLRHDHPEAAASLDPRGLVLGETEDQALRAAAIALLENSGAIAEEAAASALGRLRAARRIELAGSIVAVASSAGVVSALSGVWPLTGAMPLAVVGFVAGVIPLVSGWLRNADGGASVVEALGRLREGAWDAHALRGRVARGDAIPDLVADVNGIAGRLAGELAALGYPAAVRPL